MASICDETGHKFVSMGVYYDKQHKCSVCGLEEHCSAFDVSYKDKSDWQWRCDLPDIYVEQYEVILTNTASLR